MPHVVGAPRVVAPDQDLVGLERALRIERRPWCTTLVLPYSPSASRWPSRTCIESRTIGSSCACRCTSVSIASGSASVKKPPPCDRRKLRRIAEHQHRHAERHQVAPQLRIDHRAFVDHDQLRPSRPARRPTVRRSASPRRSRARDRSDCGSWRRHAQPLARITSAALPVKAANFTSPSILRRQMPRERGLAGARIAEQAEQRRRAALAGLVLEPAGDRLERGVLMGREFGHEIQIGARAALVAMRRVLKQACAATEAIRVEAR